VRKKQRNEKQKSLLLKKKVAAKGVITQKFGKRNQLTTLLFALKLRNVV